MNEGRLSGRRVFISYRREDCPMHAGRLFDNLEAEDADAFLDIDTIPLGVDFTAVIEREVTSCDVVIVMIGDDWLTVEGSDGQPRIEDPMDWVHLETKAALERDVPVIPVLVEGMRMPRADQLPADLRALSRRNGTELRDASWRADLEVVIRSISSIATSTSRGPSAPQASDSGGESSESVVGESEPPPIEARERPVPRRRKLDFERAKRFIESVPSGRWTSYRDVAESAGAATGAQAVGTWLRNHGSGIVHVYRVLNAKGEVSPGWAPKIPSLPQTPEAVRTLLREEGVRFDFLDCALEEQRWTVADSGIPPPAAGEEIAGEDSDTDTVIVAAGRALGVYAQLGTYICQAERSFRPGTRYLGFYAKRRIAPFFPAIVERRQNVRFTSASAAALRSTGDSGDGQVAEIIERSLDSADGGQEEGGRYQVFLLNENQGFRLPAPISHHGSGAWTQSQRYTNSALLKQGPATTDDLVPKL